MYPEDKLGKDDPDDDGTMPQNVASLSAAIVGQKIRSAQRDDGGKFVIELDNGRRVELDDSSDCCAYTELKTFLLNASAVDHVITGVATEGGYTTWHVFADMGDVLTLTVGWSSGNPFYYGYGFDITVREVA